MRINNKTRYDIGPFRWIIKRVAEAELDPGKRKRVVIYLRETTRGRSRGGAWARCPYIGGDNVIVYLPRNPDTRSCVLEGGHFAHMLAHEFAHCRGMTHKDMAGNPRYAWTDDWADFYAWTGTARLVPKVAPVKVVPSDVAKMEHAHKKAAAWETKRKRAETGMRKWKKRERYYERKMAATVAAVSAKVSKRE